MLLHLRQGADIRRIAYENSRSSTTFQVDELVFKHSVDPCLTLNISVTTQTAPEQSVRDDNWFGQDDSASLRRRRMDLEAVRDVDFWT